MEIKGYEALSDVSKALLKGLEIPIFTVISLPVLIST
jgi:hypothetical protein